MSTVTDPNVSPQRPHTNPFGLALQSTPQAKGSATVSENISAVGVKVSKIRPWITRDVENFQECPLDNMLKDFLVACSSEAPELFDEVRKTRLFEECLEKVLPICNGVAQAKNKKIKVKSSNIKENLAEYADAYLEHETKLYSLFATAANTALLFLRELDLEDIRKPAINDGGICFQVHDPFALTQTHQGQDSRRKPDVVVVSLKDAKTIISNSSKLSEEKILIEKATECPEKALGWRSVRGFVEFKRSTGKMKQPPKSYTLREYTPPRGYEYLQMNVMTEESDRDGEPASNNANRSLHHSKDSIYLRSSTRQKVKATERTSGSQAETKPLRRSARQKSKATASNPTSLKRTSDRVDSDMPESQPKRRKRGLEKKSHSVVVQGGYYGAEMFAAYAGRLHVLGFIIVGDVLYIWWYDRQGAIQCSGLNFIQDLPRFLVLLIAIQRFDDRNWGLNPVVDPEFRPREFHETTITDDAGREMKARLLLSDNERVTHFGLNGRATNLFSVECKGLCENKGLSGNKDLVIKIFWGEVSRTSEPDILKRVTEIAETEPDVRGHAPKLLWCNVYGSMSTAKVRERLGLETEGARVLYMIIFQKLSPITELSGNEFLRAWWETVKCHLALWKRGVYHRDISASNLMYRKDANGKIIGVLNDFDLASVKEVVTGTERTGTIPFMATALLTDAALQGEIKHSYEHDAESFIWVLVWITLRYDNGRLRVRNPPLDKWLGVDAIQCRKEKTDFLVHHFKGVEPGAGHQWNWELALFCMKALRRRIIDDEDNKNTGDEPNHELEDESDDDPVQLDELDDKLHEKGNVNQSAIQPWDTKTAFKTLLNNPMKLYMKDRRQLAS